MPTFAKLSMGSNSHESWADDYANEVAEKEVDKAIKEEREACAKDRRGARPGLLRSQLFTPRRKRVRGDGVKRDRKQSAAEVQG